MHELPEPIELERISRACDEVMLYMRSHAMDPQTLDAMGLLCTFVHRVKDNVEWIDTLLHVLKAKEK